MTSPGPLTEAMPTATATAIATAIAKMAATTMPQIPNNTELKHG